MSLTHDLDSVQQRISEGLITITRSTSRAYAQDISFQSAVSPKVALSINDRSKRLLLLANKLLLRSSGFGNAVDISLRDVESLHVGWMTVVDGVDCLLEHADNALDDFAGYFKKRKDDWQEPVTSSSKPKYLPHEFRSQNITKPQLLFKHGTYNNEEQPFRPILTKKPHARIGLTSALSMNADKSYTNPYQAEIEHYQYPSSMYSTKAPIPPLAFESSQAILVDDMSGVRSMLDELRQSDEIAVDLEHHDFHTYIGIVSLMQISTRHNDYIIDTLKPWRRELEILNEVFTDPNIVKVFHGAQMDVIWLQRDLGIYLVGLFDTFHASCALGYPGHSLAFLLKKFVDFDAQKQYQIADWRIRPLPSELFDYARSDTHFLLYIYDHMRNELIERSVDGAGEKIADVLQRSKEYCLQRYEHPIYCAAPVKSVNGWFSQVLKVPGTLTDIQLVSFRKIHEWRDAIARQEDESTKHVMSNYTLTNLAKALPKDTQSVLSVIGNSSHLVRTRADEIVALVEQASSEEKIGETIRQAMTDSSRNMYSPTHTDMQGRDRGFGAASFMPSENGILRRSTTSSFWGSISPSPDHHIKPAPLNLFTLALDTKTHDDTLVPVKVQKAVASKKRVFSDDDYQTNKASLRDTEDSLSAAHMSAAQSLATLPVLPKAMQRKVNVAKSVTKGQEQTFDYVNASAVIRTDRQGHLHRDREKTRESFDPFVKAAMSKAGHGRVHDTHSGRTMTF